MSFEKFIELIGLDGKNTLQKSQIDKEFHDPFITSLYRRANTDLKTTLKSCLGMSNEYFNVWSHIFVFIYFVTVRFPLAFATETLKEPLHWPLLALAVGILFLFLLSVSAHALNCMSKEARHRCFYFDYAGISIFGMTTGQALYFYCRQLNATGVDGKREDLLTSPYIFLCTSVAGSLVTNFMMCATRRQWCTSKASYRTLSCLIPFTINTYPYLQRLINCENSDDCDTTWLPFYLKHVLYLLLTAVVNVCKFPERRYPGRFDAFGQSHHFVHLFVFLACDQVFEFTHREMDRRRVVLGVHPIKPDIYNSVLLTVIGVLANLIIAWFFNAEAEDEEKKEK